MSADGQILVFNAGSSSLKVGLFDATGAEQLGEWERNWHVDDRAQRDAAMTERLARIAWNRIFAVGHRVVHGGSRFTSSVLIDVAVRAELAPLSALAPLHNQPALEMIDMIARMHPGIPQVAAFDTAFHATLAPHAYLYALPYEWYERWHARRFGFHGLSHDYCSGRAAELLGQGREGLKLITCHLGSGCSLAAVADGQSIATTMGFTPLEGLVMATRSGSVDPGLLTYLLAEDRLSLPELQAALYFRSGLRGISGLSGDMRVILAARAAGDARAALAFDVYVARLSEEIGAMTAALGGLDALVFAGGVGEHASEVRAAACAPFAWLGLSLDDAANANAIADVEISSLESRIRVLVIHTREELMVARETARLLGTG